MKIEKSMGDYTSIKPFRLDYFSLLILLCKKIENLDLIYEDFIRILLTNDREKPEHTLLLLDLWKTYEAEAEIQNLHVEYLYIFYFHWLWGLCILTIIL